MITITLRLWMLDAVVMLALFVGWGIYDTYRVHSDYDLFTPVTVLLFLLSVAVYWVIRFALT